MSVRERHISDYTELSHRIKAAGLLERRTRWYAARVATLAAAFALGFVLLFSIGQSWWQLGVAALFGILFGQGGFLSHDGAHRQVFSSGTRNEWFARLVGNLVVGLSYGWWNRKHSLHHANPNKLGKDEDVATGAIVFDPADVSKRTGLIGWVTRRQGWLFFPMLTLEGVNLHVSSLRTITNDKDLKYRKTEAALIALRLVGFPVLVFATLGLGLGAAFMTVQLMVFGVYLGASFAPNHKGMPLVPKDARVDFLRRQVLTSRNIRGGRAMSWVMGGLNFQIEHHLFPSMPSVNLRKARPIVRAYCAEVDVAYTETTLVDSYRIVIRYLNRVGLGYADPFECPFLAQYR